MADGILQFVGLGQQSKKYQSSASTNAATATRIFPTARLSIFFRHTSVKTNSAFLVRADVRSQAPQRLR